jgi:hypothetical protein
MWRMDTAPQLMTGELPVNWSNYAKKSRFFALRGCRSKKELDQNKVLGALYGLADEREDSCFY